MNMADPRNKPQQRDAADKNSASLIGPDIVITGNIEALSDLQIEGQVNGDVRCSTLVLGENGAISGSIFADRVRVVGSIDGSVQAKDLAVEATGRVVGDIIYERLKIVNGGIVEGNMKCRPAQESGKLKLVEPAAPVAPAPAKAASGHIYIE